MAPDGLDDAVADKDQLASSDVEHAFAAGRGRPLDGHDVGVANGDVEQLGSEGAPGQRSQLRQEVVADLSPPAVVASDWAPAWKVPQCVRGETALGRIEVYVCHSLVKASDNVLSCITHAHHDDRRTCPRVDPATDRRRTCLCQVGAASAHAARPFGLRDTQTGSRWISDGTLLILMFPRLIGDGYPPGSEGDSVRLAMWSVALLLAPVVCAPTNHVRVGQSAEPSLVRSPLTP